MKISSYTAYSEKKELIIAGKATSPGIALGPAFIFRPFTINISELEVKITDIGREFKLLDEARQKVLDQLEYTKLNIDSESKTEFVEIFESQEAFLNDRVLLDEIHSEIKKSKLSAAYVVSKILSEKTEHFINLENTFFRDRAFDIIDLKQKLINALLGIQIDYHLSAPSVVVAESLSPTDTINFNRRLILGFLTDKGGETAHSTIMARSLRIPSVVNSLNLSKILQPNDYLIIDGFNGDVLINPKKATIKRYRNLQESYQEYEQKLQLESDKPSITKDQVEIDLLANVDFIHEIPDVKINHADGIGLYRTEGIFIQSDKIPTEEQQFKTYKKIARDMAPQPVVIRTVDLGGDKLMDGFGPGEEMNPFLGWRAIRFCLDAPEVFKNQLRAILRASAFGNLKIMIPMVCCANEITQTNRFITEIKSELKEKDIPFDSNIETGIMIETPAAAISSPILAKYVDFFSIGTNDLTQYVLAIDRTNNKVAKSFNSFHPAVLQMIRNTIKSADKAGITVSLCGEFAANPAAVPLLLGMGLKSFSVNPYYLPKIKMMIRALNYSDCKKLFKHVNSIHCVDEIEEYCKTKLVEYIPELEYFN
jgi:phosphotransferase system enzyme I (PtsI)